MSQVLQSGLKNAVTSWKSTVGGILTVLLTLSGILTASPTWAADYGITRHQALWITLGIAGLKMAIGAIQTDGIQVPAGSLVQQTTSIQTKEP